MILIADSGSTKTDWCAACDGQPVDRVCGKGLNPYFQPEEEIGREAGRIWSQLADAHRMEAVYFYGAGCTADKAAAVRQAIMRHVRVPHVEVNTDLLAAARGMCRHTAGIACILGTGSNSCFYDGRQIASSVAPLGFILGDEGSGAALGRQLAGDLLKNLMAPQLKEAFLEQFALTPAMIIDRVYRHPFPNRFLAGFIPFMAAHIHRPEIRRIVLDGFRSFFRRNVRQYDYLHYPANFTGSVACVFREILAEAAAEMEIRIGTIVQSPLDGLIAYHSV
jgi:N-acetylglucosamine kinase-like BadF-type ATPase